MELDDDRRYYRLSSVLGKDQAEFKPTPNRTILTWKGSLKEIPFSQKDFKVPGELMDSGT